MTSASRFSAPVAQLRARAAVRPFEGILGPARALLAEAETAGGADLPALLILIGGALTTSGEFAEAVRHHTRAHDAAVAIGDRGLEAEAASGIGAALLAADDHSSALQHFERAEKLAIECGDDRLRASVLRRMGASFSILGRHEQALDQLREARAVLATQDGAALDRLHLANSTLNARSREIEAWPADHPGRAAANAALLPDWLQLAGDARREGLEHLELMALGNYAITAREAGQAPAAIRALVDLIPRYEALAMRPNVVIAWNHLGYAYEATRAWAQAKHAFEQALALLDGGGSVRERRDAHEGLARACEHTGDAWGALAALKAARAIDAAMDDEEARRLAARREHRLELARLTERWERLAGQDPLTGLHNRRALEAWLDDGARDAREPFSLLLLDLDGFKEINDQFGHAIGDRVLVDVGQFLRDGCRAGDLPVRFGGDEFVIALPGADAAEAQAIAERIRSGVVGHAWNAVAPGLAVTLSAGCACADEGGDANAVFALADRRLYQAKRMGRNRVCVAGP